MSERFERCLEKVHNEERLIADRLGWLLSSQTIFLGIYALLFQDHTNPALVTEIAHRVPWLALSIGGINYLGILAAVLSIEMELAASSDNKEIRGSWVTHLMGLCSPLFSPLGFAFIWVFAIAVQLTNAHTAQVYAIRTLAISVAVVLLFLLFVIWFSKRLITHSKNKNNQPSNGPATKTMERSES